MSERWLLILGVVAIFLGLGLAGFLYQQRIRPRQPICANAQAQCLDHPYFGN